MRSFLFALPLLATTMACAQAPAPSPLVRPLAHAYPLNEPHVGAMGGWSCPVGMTAEQQATGATQWVVSLEDSGNPPRDRPGAVGVHVALKGSKDKGFRAARVAVSYLVSPRGGMLVATTPASETRTFDLSVGAEARADLESSLLLGSGVSVTRVELLSLTYADGTVWPLRTEYNCGVRVSHVLRVATR
jgi:hypothetical protein